MLRGICIRSMGSRAFLGNFSLKKLSTVSTKADVSPRNRSGVCTLARSRRNRCNYSFLRNTIDFGWSTIAGSILLCLESYSLRFSSWRSFDGSTVRESIPSRSYSNGLQNICMFNENIFQRPGKSCSRAT